MEEYRTHCQWVDSIKMELKEIDVYVVIWLVLVQNRDHLEALANAELNLQVT